MDTSDMVRAIRGNQDEDPGVDRRAMEPRIAELMERKLQKRGQGPYRALDVAEFRSKVSSWLSRSMGEVQLHDFRRMTGGASKEQFILTVAKAGEPPKDMVLRADPLESIVETCRLREVEALRAMRGVVPVAEVMLVDGDGADLGQPALLSSFVSGVTKPPSDQRLTVSGVGTVFNAGWRERLAPQFVEGLVRIHGLDCRSAALPHFLHPRPFSVEAALWQVNWWSRVWREDQVAAYPLLTLAEQWMRRNLPVCETPIFVHGDYRAGNFMFDSQSGEITAVLDWELAHIGDFHEDLGWMVQRLFASADENGDLMVCSLLSREDLIARYEQASGRTVNQESLRFYEVLSAYKCAVMNLGTGVGIAGRGNNHQDVLLSYLSAVGHVFCDQIADLIDEGDAQ